MKYNIITIIIKYTCNVDVKFHRTLNRIVILKLARNDDLDTDKVSFQRDSNA